MSELQLTVEDRKFMRDLDAAFRERNREHHAACERKFANLAKAYQQRDAQCLEALWQARRNLWFGLLCGAIGALAVAKLLDWIAGS